MIASLLRRLGVMAPLTVVIDDETYAAAAMDNAVIDSGRAVVRLGEVAAVGRRADDLLRLGIEAVQISAADRLDVVARITRRHPGN